LLVVLSDEVPLAISRPVMDCISCSIPQLSRPLDIKNFGKFAIDMLNSRVVSFEEADSKLRRLVSKLYEESGDFIMVGGVRFIAFCYFCGFCLTGCKIFIGD
jgi:hypothetical protein